MAGFSIGPSGTLPVIYINTENNAPVTSKENYVKATYYLDPMGVEGVSAIGSASSPLDMQIKGRGNFTWTGFDKKPYRLKLGKKQALMGMPSNKHWALLAHADDSQAFLRNTVGFELSRLVGLPWTPGQQPVEFVLNGQYWGLYFLTETVRVDKNRVNVWDYDSAYEDYEEENPGESLPWDPVYATGGWLVEIDNYDDADQVKFQSIDPYVTNKTLRVTYDTPSDFINDIQKQWLLNEFKTLDEMIVKGDRNACEWANKVDITNLAKFFVVNQIVFNYESFHGSCKMSRQKGYDEKWNYGPVWDFGSAFQTAENLFIFNYGPYSNHWIKCYYEYPAFVEEVKKVYKELMEGDYNTIYTFIDSFISQIKDAAAADLQRWPQYGNSGLSEKAENVKSMLRTEVKFLDNQWMGGSQPDPTAPQTDIYLRGEFNNWNADNEYKFSLREDGIYELKVNSLDGEWKLAGPVWGEGNVDFGGANNIKLNQPVLLEFSKGNCTLASPAENITLLFDWRYKQLTVVSGDASDEICVYCVDERDNPWQQVSVFTWNPYTCGDWPGMTMTEVTPESAGIITAGKVWKYVFDGPTIPEDGKSGIIFNNGNSGEGNQTEDLVYKAGNVYYIAGTISGINGIDAEFDNETPIFYNLQGIRITNPGKGIYIVRKGREITKEILK
ncbi:MAG: CotH kinase family protein [Candidatus Amulumruptor caecigallinarius]|nr:CotH kinase family protein [Candidatus Amulumruptor caecigallinarius]